MKVHLPLGVLRVGLVTWELACSERGYGGDTREKGLRRTWGEGVSNSPPPSTSPAAQHHLNSPVAWHKPVGCNRVSNIAYNSGLLPMPFHKVYLRAGKGSENGYARDQQFRALSHEASQKRGLSVGSENNLQKCSDKAAHFYTCRFQELLLSVFPFPVFCAGIPVDSVFQLTLKHS